VFVITGLPEAEVSETRERVASALRHSGLLTSTCMPPETVARIEMNVANTSVLFRKHQRYGPSAVVNTKRAFLYCPHGNVDHG